MKINFHLDCFVKIENYLENNKKKQIKYTEEENKKETGKYIYI